MRGACSNDSEQLRLALAGAGAGYPNAVHPVQRPVVPRAALPLGGHEGVPTAGQHMSSM